MKRTLLIAVLVIALVSPLALYVYLKILEKNPPPPPNVTYNAGPVDVNQSGISPKPTKPAGSIPLPEQKLVSLRGFFRSYNDGVLTVLAGPSTREALTLTDVFTVCIPRFWGTTDTVGAYMDISTLTLDNYTQLGPRETRAQFSDYLPKFKTTTHLMIFGVQDERDNAVISKKVWIFGCESL